MNIQNTRPYSNNFKALRISPDPEQWNQQVLNAVINSKFVNNIIQADKQNERDTFISFAEHYDPAYPDYTRYNHMFFNIKGDNKDITLGSHSTYRFETGDFFRRAREIKTGPDNLGKDLAGQIKKLDNPEDKTTMGYRTLEMLKRFAGKVIIENGKDYEKFRD